MSIATLVQPDEVGRLARAFCEWIGKSAAREGHRTALAPVFVMENDAALLDAARASLLIRAGVHAGRIGELVALLGLDKKEDLSHAIDVNSTSLWRWERDDKLLPGASVERILRAMQLQLFATEVFGSVEQARKWLHKEHPLLDGMAPSDYADNEFGAQKVRGMLASLKYGGVA